MDNIESFPDKKLFWSLKHPQCYYQMMTSTRVFILCFYIQRHRVSPCVCESIRIVRQIMARVNTQFRLFQFMVAINADPSRYPFL